VRRTSRLKSDQAAQMRSAEFAMLRCEEIVGANVDRLVNNSRWGVARAEPRGIKMCLSPRYRLWMRIILPKTLGVGTTLLTLAWPRAIELETVTLRGRRRIRWRARDHRHQAPLRLQGLAYYQDRRPSPPRPIPHSGERPAQAGHRRDHSCKFQKGLVVRDPAHLALPIPGASRQPVPLDIRV
jgi:hypothetical protein